MLSTLHTNDTAASITRLRDLGIPSYLIASTTSGIIAQRLARSVCQSCKQPDSPSDAHLRRIGLSMGTGGEQAFWRGEGCSQCGGTGFKGRTAIYENLIVTERIREQISRDSTESMIRQVAIAGGMSTLMHNGLKKVRSGETSAEELIRVIQTEEDSRSTCPDCGYATTAEFVSCPHCGRALLTRCPDCGRDVDAEWSFCPYCTKAMTELAARAA